MNKSTRCGYIAIIGRPNVGKSTLLNKLLGKKISITSRKPQTTRHQILGIKTKEQAQAIYVDTPGIHKKSTKIGSLMNRLMNRAAVSVIASVDVIVFMVDARGWWEEDEMVLKKIQALATCPIVLVLNKVDLVPNKADLLPRLKAFSSRLTGAQVIPVSVIKNINVDRLEQVIYQLLPARAHVYPDDFLTDRDENFLIAETVREKIMRLTGQEVPYGTAVIVNDFKKTKDLITIDVIIWVERSGQKAILIGKKGAKLKKIGELARKDLETFFNCKVFLTLWVKVKTKWSNNARMLEEVEVNPNIA